MPYVDLVSSDDYATISYTTNAPAGSVSGFDPDKPTLVMLHPLWLDSSWTTPQLDDPRLNANFNIIVFDTRSTGKSLFRPTGRHDLWVTAADLAHCFYVSSHAQPRRNFPASPAERARPRPAPPSAPRTHLRARAVQLGRTTLRLAVSAEVLHP